MNLKQLEAFARVAECGSFSKAAKELFLTQPTVSAHIASLEKELKARLFVRNTKEVSLSEEGKVLYQYARQMIELEKTIEQIFLTGENAESRSITIAASTIPGQYLLPEILSAFAEKYPNEQFHIMETDSAEVIEKVTSGMADIGFTGTVLDKRHCKYIPFYKDELVIIMPATPFYRELAKESKDLEWLMGVPFIMREEGSGTRKEMEKHLKEMGIYIDEINVVSTMDNTELIKRSVKNGMGISIMSKLAAKDLVESGDVIQVPFAKEGEWRDLNIVYNKNYQLLPSGVKFVKLVKELYSLDD